MQGPAQRMCWIFLCAGPDFACVGGDGTAPWKEEGSTSILPPNRSRGDQQRADHRVSGRGGDVPLSRSLRRRSSQDGDRSGHNVHRSVPDPRVALAFHPNSALWVPFESLPESESGADPKAAGSSTGGSPGGLDGSGVAANASGDRSFGLPLLRWPAAGARGAAAANLPTEPPLRTAAGRSLPHSGRVSRATRRCPMMRGSLRLAILRRHVAAGGPRGRSRLGGQRPEVGADPAVWRPAKPKLSAASLAAAVTTLLLEVGRR